MKVIMNYEATVAVVMKYMESRDSTTLISLMFDKGTVTTVRVVLKKLVSVHKNEMGNKRKTECQRSYNMITRKRKQQKTIAGCTLKLEIYNEICTN